MKRTDQHSPSRINPMEYSYVLWFDYGGSSEPSINLFCGRPRFDFDTLKTIPGIPCNGSGRCCVHALRATKTFANVNDGRCDVCGASFRYGDVWVHNPTGEHIVIGHDCADKYGMITTREGLREYRKALHDQRATSAKGKRKIKARDEFIEAHDLAAVFALRLTDEQIQADTADFLEQFPKYHELNREENRHYASLSEYEGDDGCPDCAAVASEPGFVNRNSALRVYNKERERTDRYNPPMILRDMYSKLHRYGSMSEKQVAFARKLAHQIQNPPPPKPKERNVPAPEGRVQIKGVVVSVKLYDGDWGTSWKITTKVTTEDGVWLCWGTCPREISSAYYTTEEGRNDRRAEGFPDWLKGKTVQFTATLSRGDDAHFAFAKRPTKASIEA